MPVKGIVWSFVHLAHLLDLLHPGSISLSLSLSALAKTIALKKKKKNVFVWWKFGNYDFGFLGLKGFLLITCFFLVILLEDIYCTRAYSCFYLL